MDMYVGERDLVRFERNQRALEKMKNVLRYTI